MELLEAHVIDSAVHGWARPDLEPLVQLFLDGVPPGTGAALSVWHRGQEALSLWTGMANPAIGEPWNENTTSVYFSSSKGLAVVGLMQLLSDGLLDLEQPIGSVWPEFSSHGKGGLSIGDVLAHRAGVSAPIEDLDKKTVLDSKKWATLIAAQEPLWEPGTTHAYHALTFGPIVEELVRRMAHTDLRTLLAERVFSPLKADVVLGPSPTDLHRRAHLSATSAWRRQRTSGSEHADAWIARSLSAGNCLPRQLVLGDDDGLNDPDVLTAGLGAVGCVGTASALARTWSATVTETLGVRLLDEDQVAAISAPRSAGAWFFDPGPPYQRFGAGVQLASDVTPWLSPRSFGHDGAGGQCGFADPEYQVGFGFIRNEMDISDPAGDLVAALKDLLDREARAGTSPQVS
ncbi:beta-lactamase family protein [Tessaracoccus sp. OS52]|uniref:serine hydrolase domain-containing protein n=1 Tax=Tessaracoccus sp. OS52 TaxID=2886691 RepID=UPI001D10827A|nr:serine hydrolase domain-containing protein [Tessaracoccus sp. OS52]MCC2591856.1 beta-lactamase family protein [Tessaracoccus sp. OS52]